MRVIIGKHVIGASETVVLIAEIGVNHDGSVTRACEMVRAAADAGASIVKVQAFHPRCFVRPGLPYKGEDQYAMFLRYHLPDHDLALIARECDRVGVTFLGTPDCAHHARVLLDLGSPAIKVGSDDLTNLPLLRQLSGLGVPLILSSGMATLDEVDSARRAVHIRAEAEPVVLHCTSRYPTPTTEAALGRMLALRSEHGIMGYSDHTDGTTASEIAVAMGAGIVEKHFTLDRSRPGPDHAFSATPAEIGSMVEAFVRIRSAQTVPEGGLYPADIAMRDAARRSIVLSRQVLSGYTIAETSVTYLRVGPGGISPAESLSVIGRRVVRDLPHGHVVQWEDLTR